MEVTILKTTKMLLISLIPMIFWGSLFPMIKIGYKVFEINTASVADILLFASLRFVICGAIVCAFARIKGLTIEKPVQKSIVSIAFLGVFSVVLHYSFTYLGLSLAEGSKTAILKQLGSLFYVCFAFMFIKEEKFNICRIIGAIVGFMGIIAINADGGKVIFSKGDQL